MKEYKAIYKCRKCGKSFGEAITGDERLARKTLICACLETPSGEPMSPTLYFPHSCDNGDLGVADFIGWEKEVKEEFEPYENGFLF